ncbi:MAG: glycosyltransferase [Planctomycetota bacterium]|nr:MAG: glycosyltransferase [Planctomycetota bacterium]
MKIALVTTPPSVRSGIGDYTHQLLPYLREQAVVDQFVEPGREGAGWDGEPARSALELVPRAYDRVLYQLGNEVSHGFMARMVRAIGGTVAQHDWVLFDLALSAYPGLVRGGVKGHLLALREGGVDQARTYLGNWRDRRRARRQPAPELDARELPGTLVAGWHGAEPRGRWTADVAWLRLPVGARAVRSTCIVERGRALRIVEAAGRVVAAADGAGARAVLEGEVREPLVALRTSNVGVTAEQRAHGDTRRLAAFVESIEWSDGRAWHALDLRQSCFRPPEEIHLSRDRFALPLNHSIVRFADAFIVHSRYVATRIQTERNQLTPVGIVHHGAEERWRDEDRGLTRARLGLSSAWQRGFLVVSFGGVQPHKRIDKLLEAFAKARASAPDLYLALVGGLSTGAYDPRAHAQLLGVADAVHFAGYVPEELGWDWLHAGDLSVNLRGPTTGGTSGGVFQSFSLGRAVLASDAAEQSELPDACTVKVPLGAGEVEAIARELVALRGDAPRRERLEAAVRGFVSTECAWRQCARQYVELLERFPAARASRKGLLDLKLGLSARRAAV